MAKQTTPLQNLKYIETVLKDVQAVLKKMHEDKSAIPFEQRGKLSGCLDELYHALGTIQDDEVGLRGKVERLMSIEQRVEPPLTKAWTRYRGTLLQCLNKAADTYYYQTQEDQGEHDWRILAFSIKPHSCGLCPHTDELYQRASEGLDNDTFRPYELLERIASNPDQAALPAILDYDEGWFGKSVYLDSQAEALWTHAKLFIVGDNTPLALIYRIDFEEEEDQDEEKLGDDYESIEQHLREITEQINQQD